MQRRDDARGKQFSASMSVLARCCQCITNVPSRCFYGHSRTAAVLKISSSVPRSNFSSNSALLSDTVENTEEANTIIKPITKAQDLLHYMLTHQFYSMDRLISALNICGRAEEYEMCDSIEQLIRSKPLRITVAAYDVMIKVAMRQKHYERVIALYHEREHAIEPCSNITSDTSNVLVHTIVLDAYARLKWLDEMERHFRNVISQFQCEQTSSFATSLYNVVIDAYLSCGRFSEGWARFEEMDSQGILKDSITYGTVMGASLRSGNYIQAMQTYNLMRASTLKPDTYLCNMAIRACAAEGSLDKAMAVLSYMKISAIPPDAYTYSYLIKSLVEARKFDQARDMLHEMQTQEIIPISLTYHPFLKVLSRQGDMDAVESTLRTMAEASVALGTATVCTILRSLFESKHFDAAEKFHASLLARGVASDTKVLNVMLKGLMDNGFISRAENMFKSTLRDVSTLRSDIVSYNTMLSGYIRNGQLLNANNLLIQLEESRDIQMTIITYNTLLETAAATGDVSLLTVYLAKINTMGMQKDIATYNAMIECYLRADQLRDAIDTSTQMIADGHAPTLKTHAHFIRYLAEHAQSNIKAHADLIENILADLLDKGMRPNVHIINQLMKAARNAHKPDKAIETYALLSRFGIRPNQESINYMLRVCSDREYYETATTLIKSLQTTGFSLSLVNYELYFRLLSQGGRFEELLQALEQFRQTGLSARLKTLQSITGPLYWHRDKQEIASKFETYFHERFPSVLTEKVQGQSFQRY